MRMTVLKPFHDKDNFSKIYQVGQVVEFDEERADRLLRLGLATETESKKENPVEEMKEQPKVEEPKVEVQEELPLEAETPKKDVPAVKPARRNPRR